jgi:hypothetical protein
MSFLTEFVPAWIVSSNYIAMNFLPNVFSLCY